MDNDIKLDGSLADFSVNLIGAATKESFIGTFTVKCVLNPIEEIKANKLYRELLGETNPHLANEDIHNLALALSQLKFRVVKSPAGWKHSEIDGGHLDANIVLHVFNMALEARILFHKEAGKRVEGLKKKLEEQFNNGELTKNNNGEIVE